MATRIRERDWSTHPLGDPATWPRALTMALATCLSSSAPMHVWWGRDLTVFYNDAAISTVEDHPDVLGGHAPDVWNGRWSAIESSVEQVFATGASAVAGDLVLSPLFDDGVAGVLLSELRRSVPRIDPRTEADFLARIGHELRNPLSTISTMLQALLMRGSTHELVLIERATRDLTRLVEDLLESSRLATGKIALQLHPIELARIIDHAMELASRVFAEKHSKVSVSVPRVGWRVEADPERLARAISNVLVNAAQHSAAGTRITIEVERTGDRIRLRIADEGPGIPAHQLEGVFEAFQTERTSGGLGLGLSITHGIVTLHGGTIEVRSSTSGTTCDIALVATQLPAAEPVPVTPVHRKRLLLVEDNDDAARALRTALEQLGYEVALAHDAPIALNLARSFAPDVALLDLGLPVMDGWELARRLRHSVSDLPVVAVTARDQEADRQRSAQEQFAEHLVKPIDLGQLERVVEALPAKVPRGGSSR